MSANLENSAAATGLEKVSFHPNTKEVQCQRKFKLCMIALTSHTSKVMLKTLQAMLQQEVNLELPDVQAGFRKGRGTTDQIANICQIIEKARKNSRKTSISASLTMQKPWSVWITANCWEFFKRWESQTTLSTSWEICMKIKKQQLKQRWNSGLVPN